MKAVLDHVGIAVGDLDEAIAFYAKLFNTGPAKVKPGYANFALENPRHGYIVRWDAPKVAALKEFYPGVYSATFLRD